MFSILLPTFIEDKCNNTTYFQVATIAIAPRIGDIIGYLRTRLKEDTDSDAMDSSPEADILRKIP